MQSQSQPQMKQEEQPLETTPVIVSTPDMESEVLQSSVWWVNTKDKRRPFFVISKNQHNHDSKTVTGFWLNEHLNKNEDRLSVKINFKDMKGRFQQGWVNVNTMTTVSYEDLDTTLGQSTKGFVYKVMDNLTRKLVGTSGTSQYRENNNQQHNHHNSSRGGSYYRKRQPQQQQEENTQQQE